jgi:metal-responsive CopG/Arc/MetJ family transcriptional regulator
MRHKEFLEDRQKIILRPPKSLVKNFDKKYKKLGFKNRSETIYELMFMFVDGEIGVNP